MTPQEYFASLRLAIGIFDARSIDQAVAIIREARDNDKTVYIFGNGGSASTAEHFVGDLVKMAGVRAFALTTLPILTAYANDEGYEASFIGALKVMGRDDVAVGISCSGQSKNVLHALDLAPLLGKTIMLTSEGSPTKGNWNCVVRVPGDDIRIQEDIHLAVCHAIAGALREM